MGLYRGWRRGGGLWADGCPFWFLSVSVQVYCNEYGKIMRQTRHWK